MMMVYSSIVWGKTLRDGSDNVFGIKRSPQTICPRNRVLHVGGSTAETRFYTGVSISSDHPSRHCFRPTF